MALIKTFGFTSETDSQLCDFVFEIPDNCNFSVNYDSSKEIYTVSVQLNAGQTQPSSTFTPETYSFDTLNGLLEVHFQETYNSVTTKRPKLIINENNC